MEYEDDHFVNRFRECILLLDILRNPISTVVARYKRLNINPKIGNKWKDFLITREIIIPKRIITRAGWTVLFEITEKGKETLRAADYNVTSTLESIEHRFWKQKIAEHYQARGYAVKIENPRNGNADIAIKKGKERIAVEIETGKSDHLNNIIRNLEAGYKSVVCVPTNRFVLHKINEDIAGRNFKRKVKTILASKFEITL